MNREDIIRTMVLALFSIGVLDYMVALLHRLHAIKWRLTRPCQPWCLLLVSIHHIRCDMRWDPWLATCSTPYRVTTWNRSWTHIGVRSVIPYLSGTRSPTDDILFDSHENCPPQYSSHRQQSPVAFDTVWPVWRVSWLLWRWWWTGCMQGVVWGQEMGERQRMRQEEMEEEEQME